jgi:hypothetical protein
MKKIMNVQPLRKKTEKLILKTRKRSKQSYAAALKSCPMIPLRNEYESLSESSENPDEENQGARCSYWDNFVKPRSQKKISTASLVPKSDIETKKRSRSSSREIGKNVENQPKQPKTKKRIGEKRYAQKVQEPTNKDSNVKVDTVKNIISSLMCYFSVPSHVQSMILAIVFPLIDPWWPSICSFMSEKTGVVSSRKTSRNV